MATSLKKKYTQNDLRRLMSEQKAKTAPKTTTTTINSPLAKYNDLGQLMCVLCKTVVRSEDVWKVHINAKQHKQNVELAKKSISSTPPPTSASHQSAASKRMAPPLTTDMPAKMSKGSFKSSGKAGTAPMPQNHTADPKTSTTAKNALPDNFFDNQPRNAASFYETTITKTSIKTNLVSIKRNIEADKLDDGSPEVAVDQHKDETLPEGFFDDPIKDAKARNSEYKDPVEEEWEKFQQEIKAASDFSNAIIAEDQEEAITERQIDEIDEQIRNWNRVLELEKMKENVNLKVKDDEKVPLDNKLKIDNTKITETNSNDTSDDDDDIGDVDEYLDWRSKKAYK